MCGGIFPSMMPDEAQKHFDTVVVGEGEGVWLEVLADFEKGALKPRYQADASPSMCTSCRRPTWTST